MRSAFFVLFWKNYLIFTYHNKIIYNSSQKKRKKLGKYVLYCDRFYFGKKDRKNIKEIELMQKKVVKIPNINLFQL